MPEHSGSQARRVGNYITNRRLSSHQCLGEFAHQSNRPEDACGCDRQADCSPRSLRLDATTTRLPLSNQPQDDRDHHEERWRMGEIKPVAPLPAVERKGIHESESKEKCESRHRHDQACSSRKVWSVISHCCRSPGIQATKRFTWRARLLNNFVVEPNVIVSAANRIRYPARPNVDEFLSWRTSVLHVVA